MDQIDADPQVPGHLPIRAYSLGEFTARAENLFRGDVREFIRFLLTGEVPGQHQAAIDPLRDYLHEAEDITVSRDYDSVLGITEEIVIECGLCINPVSNPTDALSTSIHLNHAILGRDGQVGTSVPVQELGAKATTYRQRHLPPIIRFPT